MVNSFSDRDTTPNNITLLTSAEGTEDVEQPVCVTTFENRLARKRSLDMGHGADAYVKCSTFFAVHEC